MKESIIEALKLHPGELTFALVYLFLSLVGLYWVISSSIKSALKNPYKIGQWVYTNKGCFKHIVFYIEEVNSRRTVSLSACLGQGEEDLKLGDVHISYIKPYTTK